MRIYKHIITILVLANMFLMFACTNDMDISQPVEPGLEDKVSISLFTRAQDYSIPVTRGGANETGIEKTPYVLVFKVDGTSTKCIETVRAVEDLTTDKRYVLLTRQATGTYRFLILANNGTHFYFEDQRYEWSESNLETYLVGKELSYISENLLTDKLDSPQQNTVPYTSSGWDHLLPMSYLTDPVSGINDNTKIGEVGSPLQMVRGVAKLVFINEPELYLDSSTSSQMRYNKFVMGGVVSIMNTPRQGKVYNMDDNPLTTIGLTEVAKNDYSDMLLSMQDVNESWAPPYMQASWGDPCYVHETAADGGLFFIIKGDLTADFGTGTEETRTFYYKMAPVDNNFAQIGIERNHSYEFRIINVRGPGHSTVAEAMAAPPSNKLLLDYEVTSVDLSSHHVIANGHYYLGVSNSRYITYTDEPGTWQQAFSIVTDYFSQSGAWSPIRNEILSTQGITCDVSAISSSADASHPQVVNVKFDNSISTGWVEVWLGDLTLTVRVDRSGVVPVGGEKLIYYKYYKDPGAGNEWWEYEHYLINGNVDSGASSWIKLAPGSETIPSAAVGYTSGGGAYFSPDPAVLTNVTDVVTSGIGKIQVYITDNSIAAGGTGQVRNGTFYLSTGYHPSYAPQNWTDRIKIDIKQAGS